MRKVYSVKASSPYPAGRFYFFATVSYSSQSFSERDRGRRFKKIVKEIQSAYTERKRDAFWKYRKTQSKCFSIGRGILEPPFFCAMIFGGRYELSYL